MTHYRISAPVSGLWCVERLESFGWALVEVHLSRWAACVQLESLVRRNG